MNRSPFVFFLLSLLAVPAWAENPDDCADLVRLERGKNCGKPESVEMTLSNRCSGPMDLRFCLEMQNGKWNCGLQFDAPPGKTIKWLACEGTGKYQLWARTPKASAPFPEENGAYRNAGRAVFAVASGETEVSACKRASVMAGAGGACDCEALEANPRVIRCRAQVAADAELPAGRPPRAFEPTMFSVVATARGKDLACAQARQLAGAPDGACACQNFGTSSQCRVTSGRIRSQSEREALLKALRCDPARDPACQTASSGRDSGVRD